MKRTNLLSVAALAVLTVVALGCTTMRGSEGDYYTPRSSHRIYTNEPYRRNVILERDPFTGRYYERKVYYDRGYNRYGNTRHYPARRFSRR